MDVETDVESLSSAYVESCKKRFKSLKEASEKIKAENSFQPIPTEQWMQKTEIGTYISRKAINNGRKVFMGPDDGCYYISRFGTVSYIKVWFIVYSPPKTLVFYIKFCFSNIF